MAKAMGASGFWNPKATRVMGLILVFMDSMRLLDGDMDLPRCLAMDCCSFTKARIWDLLADAAQGRPRLP